MDLLLDPLTHDVVFINGETPVASSQQDVVAQRLKVRLNTFFGEWFLDTSIGIPYFEQVLTKGFDKQSIDALFQAEILSDDGVMELVSYNSTLDSQTRRLRVVFSVRVADDGVVPIDFTLLGG